MKHIEKIRLLNFKRFKTFSAEFDSKLNIIVGDNEAGKSSILSAIDLVISGNRSKVESLGLEALFNSDVINTFLVSGKKYEDLPKLSVEIYLNEQNNLDLNGKCNDDERICDGLKLLVEPNDELSREIKDILTQEEANFPYEFYSITFKTFSGDSYSGYRRFLKHILIDNTHSSNEYATREYIKDIYHTEVVDSKEKFKHSNEYRKHKDTFKKVALADLNSRSNDYHFGIRTSSKSNLETDLTLLEQDISIENKGKGRQCFIKTEFALRNREVNLDLVLIEEPENHLSHLNMKRLIKRIGDSNDKQLIIATHSDLVSSRLDLRKCLLVNSSSSSVASLKSLPEDTAKFFIKAPNNSILQFILSKKVILVEGDSEYILMETFYEKVTGKKPEDSEVHVISVGGTSFKRYLDIAKLLGIKTAVVRDNDGDYNLNCVNLYSDYTCDTINVFYHSDNNQKTFEVVLYEDNKSTCEKLFSPGRVSLTVQQYMLQNKADCAFELLDKKSSEIVTPAYIQQAIEWIKE